MIAQLRGNVVSRSQGRIVIDCGGVGYELCVPDRTLEGLPGEGAEATVLSHLIVREDSMQLYGFGSETERSLFTQLISVAGIGPRMALAALSQSSPDDLRRAIAAGDAKRFQAVPGIGRKTAERIIVELRDRISDELASGLGADAPATIDARLLAREGLVTLGYELTEAEAMLDAVGAEIEITEPEELIAAALRGAAKAA